MVNATSPALTLRVGRRRAAGGRRRGGIPGGECAGVPPLAAGDPAGPASVVGGGVLLLRNTVSLSQDNWKRGSLTRTLPLNVAMRSLEANVAPSLASIWVSFSGTASGAASLGGACSFNSGSIGAAGMIVGVGVGRGVALADAPVRPEGLAVGRAAGRLRVCCAWPVAGQSATARPTRPDRKESAKEGRSVFIQGLGGCWGPATCLRLWMTMWTWPRS